MTAQGRIAQWQDSIEIHPCNRKRTCVSGSKRVASAVNIKADKMMPDRIIKKTIVLRVVKESEKVATIKSKEFL